MTQKNEPNNNAPPKTFEESLEKVEMIISRLEQGDLDLQTSLTCFEEGVHLLKNCDAILTQAKEKIDIFSKIEPSGKAQLTEVKLEDFSGDFENNRPTK